MPEKYLVYLSCNICYYVLQCIVLKLRQLKKINEVARNKERKPYCSIHFSSSMEESSINSKLFLNEFHLPSSVV